MKKKNRTRHRQFTTAQKVWIYILLFLLLISICLTIFQLFKILTPKKKENQKSVVSTTQPIQQEDHTELQISEDAGKEYVDHSLFLGDSNTVRFMEFTDNEGNTYTTKKNTIAVVGMGVQAIDSLECMEFSTGTYTIVKSVEILQPKRIIVTFGTNNLTGNDAKESREAFIGDYEKQLKKIYEACTNTDLIVNSIPPIAKNTIYKNLNALEIKHWNEDILKMCEKNEWHYLNSYSSLADEETGYALEGMMDTDGLHLSKKGIHTLFSYIRTHASSKKVDYVEHTDVPEIIGPKTDLYTVNPLSGKSFDESVLHPADPTVEPAQETNEVTNDAPVEEPTEPTPEQPSESQSEPDSQPTSLPEETQESTQEGQ